MYFSPGVFTAYLILFGGVPPLVGAAATNTTRTTVSPSHSLPESYQFDPRDGWESVIVTNLRYKYRRSPASSLGTSFATAPNKTSSSVLKRPSRPSTDHASRKSFLRSVRESLAELTKNIIASGEPEPVTLTWSDHRVTSSLTPS
ncbi:hypothetical protein JVU11DRAFT_1776 [Chiua virens]|nr:hypothetical protein JVU11DRAFT_1776 [Chiua virens]